MFDLSKITKVYSGRRGCMCGCKGQYKYGEAFKAEETRSHGYEVDASDRSVKLIANKVEKLLADRFGPTEEVDVADEYFYVELENGRCYAIYFAAEKTEAQIQGEAMEAFLSR